jgi:4'-phosphopantetheinyl transferase
MAAMFDISPSSLPIGIVHLWCLPEPGETLTAILEAAPTHLSSDEWSHYKSFSNLKVARRFMLGRVLLRCVLSHYLGTEPHELIFSRSKKGKPLLDFPKTEGLVFNLSHSGDQSILAVAWGSHLGVDLENIDRAPTTLKIAGHFFSAQESQEILALGNDANRHALMHWVLKEALVKALGETVWDGLKGAQFTIKGSRIRWLASSSLPECDSTAWGLGIWAFRKNHLLAVATKNGNNEVPVQVLCPCYILGGGEIEADLFHPIVTTG